MLGYHIRYCRPDGTLITFWDAHTISSLKYVITENAVGALELVLPPIYGWDYFQPDNLLIVERSTGGGYANIEERAWLLQDWVRVRQSSGRGNVESLVLYASDGNTLLDRRVIAYASGSAQANRTGTADDVLKAYVRDNLGASAAAARQVTGFTVQADASAGPSIAKDAARKNLLSTCQEIASDSWKAGVYLVFDTVYTGAGGFEFRTYTGQRGVNRTYTGSPIYPLQPISADLREIHTDERNAIYAGGEGKGDGRNIQTAENTTWSQLTRFSRREAFIDARSGKTNGEIAAEANAELFSRRPRVVLDAQVQQYDGAMYGVDYSWGDMLPVQYGGALFYCHLSALNVTYADKKETLEMRFRGEWAYAG